MSTVYIGTYTHRDGQGIYRAIYQTETGELRDLALVAEQDHPSWLLAEPAGPYLYAVSEIAEGEVLAYAIDPVTHELELISRQSTGGGNPCHLALSPDGRWLAVANYVGGSIAVLAVEGDGMLGEADVIQYEGHGSDLKRQTSSHPHGVWFAHDRLWVADLGLDLITSYAVTTGGIDKASAVHTATPPGSGPRHLAFHPTLPLVYVVGELDSTLNTYRMDGSLQLLSSISTRLDTPTDNRAGAIAIHPSGHSLYVSNRGDESIASFELDETTGTAMLSRHTSAGGTEPRHISVDPSGRFVLVTNQNSSGIVTLAISSATGALGLPIATLAVPSPTTLVWPS